LAALQGESFGFAQDRSPAKTVDELRFRAINERGQAFDCGSIPAAGTVEAVACNAPGAGQEAGLTPPPN